MDLIDRFQSKVDDQGECWLWTASKTPNGYGKFHVEGRCLGAHRVAYWLSRGEWPKNMALHRCGNKLCVRPDHLYDGDEKDNYVDSIAHGTAVSGEDHPSAKLRASDVRRIRSLLAGSPATKAEIARSFGVTPQLVGLIESGRAWKSVE